MNNIYLLIVLLSTLPAVPGTSVADSESITNRYVSMALQGDLSTAEALFDKVNIDVAPLAEAELIVNYRARFMYQNEDLAPGSGDAFADAVIKIYRDYWVRSLTGGQTQPGSVRFLESSLLKILDETEPNEENGDTSDVYARVGAVLRDRGFYYLNTYAPPLHDLFLWKRQENIRYRVRLTDLSQPVRVTFMSEIYSLGWKEFATLGRASTTGWVEGTRLYCVANSYDRSSETFRVTYLKHESRHLADFERYPGLSSEELEYRAKLTELAFASTTLRSLLDDFSDKSADNPDSPHAAANYRVTRDMYQAMYNSPLPESGYTWKSVDVNTANEAARKLLQQNTEGLSAAHK